MSLAKTTQLPYYAVIFSSLRSDVEEDYGLTSDRMMELAQQQPGFLGVEHARDQIGITVSYWQDLAAIKNWKEQAEHQIAQKLGKEKWYTSYRIRICKVEHEYGSPA